MQTPEQYIKEGLKIVEDLVKQHNLQAALNVCQELLKVNPYDKTLHDYLQKVQDLIIEDNERRVNADLDATMHLWDEAKYDELAKIYEKLAAYAPNHKRLRSLMMKLASKVEKQRSRQKESFIENFEEALAKLRMDERYPDMIQACNEVLSMDPLNEKAKRHLKEAKEALVDKNLRENNRLIEGSDFERALEFLNTLLSIDPENARVKQLQTQIKSHLSQRSEVSQRMDLNESILRMNDLFDKSEFEKVVEVCNEIENLSPGNFTAKVFKGKAEKIMQKESNRLIVKQLKETWAAMKPDYKKNKAAYVRV
ncbi:MAG: hypothetical protein AAB606_00105 [Patescibacteria group bacterium]